MHSDEGILNVGISRINKEHEAISDLCKEIVTAIGNNRSSDEVKSRALELTTMIAEHFKEEECLFEPLQLALEEQHKEEHMALVGKLAAITEEIEQESGSLRKNFDNFSNLLQRHISYDFEMKHSHKIF